jgi:hypothetical protein
VIAGLRGRAQTIRAWLANNFKSWQLLGVSLIFILTSATVSRDLGVYAPEIIFAAFIQLVNLTTIVLMVWALPDETLVSLQRIFERVLGPAKDGEESGRVDGFVVLAAIWVGVLAAGFSWFIYESHPHIEDEVIYLYHARYFVNGALTVPAPPVPEAFSFYMIPYRAERWFSIFPPGWPAMLALGVFFGAPWLVNPVLASLNVLLSYLTLCHIYSRGAARLAVMLLCLSPWFVFMGMNFMAHTFTLTCALLALLAVLRAGKTARSHWALIAGCSVGTLSLIRPLDALVMGGLLGCWAVFGKCRLKLSSVGAFALGAVAVGAFVLPYNYQITGSPTDFPLMNYYEKYFGPNTNSLGFGPERGLNWPIDPFPGHSVWDAVINANLNTFSINIELFGWVTGSLIMVGLFLFSGALGSSDYFMLAIVVVLAGALSLYWFSGGPDFGARYWYLMVVPLVALTVRGMQFLESTFERLAGCPSQSTRVTTAVLSLSMLALVNFFPWRAIDKYHHYLGMRPDIRYLQREHDFGKSVVLIRGNVHPDYQSAWVYNPLDPYADEPIYAWDQSPKVRAQVLRAYPDRPVWIVNGPTITGRGYEVLAGPLSAQDFPAHDS